MAHPTGDKLMSDLKTVVADAEALLKATAGHMGDKVEAARSRAEDSVRQARERLESLEGDLSERARDTAEDAERYVKDNPWAAIGIAAGVAFVVGLLVGRR
jgi:ElaB/YqjD/DUF883 family membrane-anchored ribosome-binding protein